MARYPFTSALVTGASSGIGEAMARLLAEAGVPTVVVARRADRLDVLAERHPGTIEVLTADLTTAEGLEAVAARAADDERPIDLLVNNAGFGSSGSFGDIDPSRIRGEIDLNIVALTMLTRAALPDMLARRRGWILNTSSIASFQPAPSMAVYAATKAYVTSFTEGLHEELRGSGVHATALCPGLTHTEFQQVSSTESLARAYPSFVWLSAAQVAATGLADCAAGRALSIPGLQYRALVTVSGFTPRAITRRVAGLVTRR